jgi:hypothetical protein
MPRKNPFLRIGAKVQDQEEIDVSLRERDTRWMGRISLCKNAPHLEKTTHVDERFAFEKIWAMLEEPTFGTGALIVSPEVEVLRPIADFMGEGQGQPCSWERDAVNCLWEECTSAEGLTPDQTATLVFTCDQPSERANTRHAREGPRETAA